MLKIMNAVVFAGAACALLTVSGCASMESVERAQASAERAQITADGAMSAAGRAQQTAGNAQTSADRAQQTAAAAQTTADRSWAASSQSRNDVTALNQQVESQRTRRGMRD